MRQVTVSRDKRNVRVGNLAVSISEASREPCQSWGGAQLGGRCGIPWMMHRLENRQRKVHETQAGAEGSRVGTQALG